METNRIPLINNLLPLSIILFYFFSQLFSFLSFSFIRIRLMALAVPVLSVKQPRAALSLMLTIKVFNLIPI